MLVINRIAMLIVAGKEFGFLKESGTVIPFSVDMSDLCRSFRVESNTTIKMYIDYGVLLIDEMRNVIIGRCFLDNVTIISYRIIFRTQKRFNCKLCGIIRRGSGFIVDVHRFLQRETFFNFDEGWTLIFDLRQVLVRNFASGCVRW